jgi:hypothetical protein
MVMTQLTKIVGAAMLCLIPTSASGEDKCKTYSGTVNWTKASGDIYTNTTIWMCISTAEGKCDAKGGYLFIRNVSTEYYARVSSNGAGLHDHHVPAAPGRNQAHTETHRLAIYRKPGQNIPKIDMSVTYCRK